MGPGVSSMLLSRGREMPQATRFLLGSFRHMPALAPAKLKVSMRTIQNCGHHGIVVKLNNFYFNVRFWVKVVLLLINQVSNLFSV